MLKYCHAKAGCCIARFGVTSFLNPCWESRTVMIRVLAVPSCLGLSTVYRVLPPSPLVCCRAGDTQDSPHSCGAPRCGVQRGCPRGCRAQGTGAEGRAGAGGLPVPVVGGEGWQGLLGVRGPELGAGSCCDSFASLALLPSAAPQSCSLPAAACGSAEGVAVQSRAVMCHSLIQLCHPIQLWPRPALPPTQLCPAWVMGALRGTWLHTATGL